jgi:hypothetical protein
MMLAELDIPMDIAALTTALAAVITAAATLIVVLRTKSKVTDLHNQINGGP